MLFLVELIQVIPELQVPTNDVRVLFEEDFEGFYGFFLISQSISINVGLENQTARCVNFVLEIGQNR